MKPDARAPAEGAARTADKPQILIVDDHPITRVGLRALIEQEGSMVVCGEADSAPLALELVSRKHPAAAIVDISLKTMNGLELIKNLRAIEPKLNVLVVSMHDENVYAERALRAGAKGYLMKQESGEKMLMALRRILAGELHMSDAIKERMVKRLVNAKTPDGGFSLDQLSDREMEVFQLIGNGFGTREIAARLNLSVKTIDSYREHLKLKLRLAHGTDLVRHAVQWVKSETV